MKIWPRPHDSFLSFAQRPQRAGETVEPRLSPSRKFIIIGEPGDEARSQHESGSDHNNNLLGKDSILSDSISPATGLALRRREKSCGQVHKL